VALVSLLRSMHGHHVGIINWNYLLPEMVGQLLMTMTFILCLMKTCHLDQNTWRYRHDVTISLPFFIKEESRLTTKLSFSNKSVFNFYVLITLVFYLKHYLPQACRGKRNRVKNIIRINKRLDEKLNTHNHFTRSQGVQRNV